MFLLLLVVFSFILSVLHLAGLTAPPDVLIFAFIFIFSGVYLGILRTQYYKPVCQALTIGYLLRVILIFVDVYMKDYFLLPNSGADSEMFYWGSVAVAEGSEFYRTYFVFLIGKIFYYMGVSRIWAQFLVMLCSVGALHFVYRILIECKVSEKQMGKVMLILCLLPNMMILSCIFVRESVIYLCLSISLYFFVLWVTRKQDKFFIFAVLCSFGAMRFHSGTIAIPIGYFIVRFIYDNKTSSFAINAKNILLSAIVLAVCAYVATNYQDELLSKMGKVENLGDIAAIDNVGGSSYAQYVGNSGSPIQFIIFTPVRMFFFLFSPLPMFWRGLADILAFCFSSTFYLWGYISARKYLALHREHGEKRVLVISLLILAICSSFVFGWGTSNAGTACRHREKMAILYGVLIALSRREKNVSFEIIS